MKSLINDLKSKNIIDENIDVLSSRLEGLSLDIVKNLLKNQHKAPNRKRYPTEVKMFANTIYHYSPRAYQYIQPILGLPHPETVVSWSRSSDGDLTNMIDLIKSQAAANPRIRLVNLVIDEMAIHI